MSERRAGRYIKEKFKDVFGITAYQKHKDPDYQKGKPDYRLAWAAFQFTAPFSYREKESGAFARMVEKVYEGEGSSNLYTKTFGAMEIITTAGILIGIALNPDQLDKVGSLAGGKIAFNLAMNVIRDFMEATSPERQTVDR